MEDNTLMEAIKQHRKQMGWKYRVYWFFKANYLSYKYRFQDFINDKIK